LLIKKILLAFILIIIIVSALFFLNLAVANFNQEKEKAFADGYLQGLHAGVGSGYNVRDPSYLEMIRFIAQDKTNLHPYVENSYTCWQFSADVLNNAFKAGYRGGFVYITLAEGAHSIVCFNTTDRGLIFVEPQDDSLENLQVGIHYFDPTKYSVNYNDTIVSYVIIW
jgi:hypothetical protein